MSIEYQGGFKMLLFFLSWDCKIDIKEDDSYDK